jgi:hypothetical protein
MIAGGTTEAGRQKVRRELLRQYVRLQRELIDADPASSSYQSTIHAFRQMGYALITSGFEDDLDRLLRLRVLDGGLAAPTPASARTAPVDLQVIEQQPILFTLAEQ